MRPQEGRLHRERRRLADAPDDAQHLQLVLCRQPVSALDLDAPRPLGCDLAHADHRLVVKPLLRRAVQQIGRIEDPAAPAGDLFVTQAVDLVQKLPLAAARIDQMRVRIAERRKEHPSPGVDRPVGLDLRRNGHRPECGDAARVGEQPCVVQTIQPPHLRAAQTRAALGLDPRDAGDMGHEQLHTVRRNRIDASIWGYITSSLSMNGTTRR